MDKIKLAEAVAEAKKFIGRAFEYEREVEERLTGTADELAEWTEFGARQNPKATGAIRRQSIELTRALAQLRKPA